MAHQLLKSFFREIGTHPGIGKVATGGKLGGALSGAISTARGVGKAGAFAGHYTLGTSLGRVATGMAAGTAVGAFAAYRSSDQYSSTNSTVNRMMLGAAFGAVGGAAVGAGFNIATKGAMLGIDSARSTIGNIGTMVARNRYLAKSGITNQKYGFGAFAQGLGLPSMSRLGGSLNMRTAANIGITAGGLGVSGAAIYGGIKMNNSITNSRRAARVARFQDSANGLVQGMHRNR